MYDRCIFYGNNYVSLEEEKGDLPHKPMEAKFKYNQNFQLLKEEFVANILRLNKNLISKLKSKQRNYYDMKC